MFCPECGTLMFPSDGRLLCGNEKCGFERGLTSKDLNVTKVPIDRRSKPVETLVLDEITETLPKTRAECPKCGHFEAFWIMRQTRAADEPTTRIYRCAKCSHTWREY